MNGLQVLTEEELASLTDEEIVVYARRLSSLGSLITKNMRTPNSKFNRRLQDIREGRDPDKENPKRKPKSAYYIPKKLARKAIEIAVLPP